MKKFFQRLLGLFRSQNRSSNSAPSRAKQASDTGTASKDCYPCTGFAYLAILAQMSSECFDRTETFEPLQFPVMDSILGNEDGLVHLIIQGNEALPPQSVVIGRVKGCYGIFEGKTAHTSVNGRHRVNLIADIERSIALYMQEDRACVLQSFDIISSSQVNNKFGGFLTEKILEIFNGRSEEPVIYIIRQGDTEFTLYPLEDFLSRLREKGFIIEWRDTAEEDGCLSQQQRSPAGLYTDDIFPLGRPYTFGLTR
jgi:hypothetical protein